MLERPDLRVAQAFAALEHSVDFQVLLTWMQANLDKIRKDNDSTKDEALTRWNQGASQSLQDFIDFAQTARSMVSRRK
jgi:hypothetical protein